MAEISSSRLPLSKISIPGPTLSSLLHHSVSSPSNLSGFLFGHLTPVPSPDPTDDSDPTTSSPPLFSLTITSFLSAPDPTPFFDSLGLLPNALNPNPYPNSLLVGWFSSRRRSPLRPSMRELAVSHNLSRSLTRDLSRTCIFLLLSSFSTSNQAVHTHEYRAFTLLRPTLLRQVSVDVVNVGPKFRGQYGAFSPEAAAFPLLPCRVWEDEGESNRASGSENRVNGEEMPMDWEVLGFGVERLEGLVGDRAAEYTKELEDLYGKMLGKLEGLVRLVETSSVKVRDQESRNTLLRNKIAGLE